MLDRVSGPTRLPDPIVGQWGYDRYPVRSYRSRHTAKGESYSASYQTSLETGYMPTLYSITSLPAILKVLGTSYQGRSTDNPHNCCPTLTHYIHGVIVKGEWFSLVENHVLSINQCHTAHAHRLVHYHPQIDSRNTIHSNSKNHKFSSKHGHFEQR